MPGGRLPIASEVIRACLLALLLRTLDAQVVQPSAKPASGLEQLGLNVPMRDGTRLAADVFLPEATGRFPAVLIRTPYNRKSLSNRSYRIFVKNGYAVIIEDVRGRFASQGIFGNIEQEGPDGSDTIDWIAQQAWSNGKVAMAGSSYPGVVQWWAALQDNPHLFAILPICSGDDEYSDRFYSPGGAMKLGHRLVWISENFTPPALLRPPFANYIFHLPLRTSDVAATTQVVSAWRAATLHPSFDGFWQSRSIRLNVNRIQVPVLSMGGWFDNYVQSDLDMFSRLSSAHKPVETWIGPWGHVLLAKFPTLDFGPEADVSVRGLQLKWLNRVLQKGPPADNHRKLHLFIMGKNVWRDEGEWPLARTHFTPMYFGSGGHANASSGDGFLKWEPSATGPADSFTYDPKNPVPTRGGAICCNPRLLPPGPLEQNGVERRRDVLVYTSPLLLDAMEVTGPVRAILYVATSANDTDFTVKLVDVDAKGRALLICDGIQRLRYRLSLDRPVFVKRNTAYQIVVDSGVTSYVFAAGHRIRIEVSSSNFPRFDRNLNMSGPNADGTKMSKAKQTLFHEKNYPSAIILPVIPKHPGREVSRKL